MVMNQIRSKLAEQAGMTIIEIIIIVLIIGVLAATVFVQFINTSKNAQTAACLANQAAIKTSLSIYYSQYLDYPNDLNVLAPYFVEEKLPECPSGGSYQLIDENDVYCTLEEHN